MDESIHYWTGTECKRGHTAPRYKSDRSCTACKLDRSKKWAADNPEQHLRICAAFRKRNLSRLRREDLARQKQYPQKYAELAMRRHTAKLQRMPPWADLEAIKFFYDYCPKGCQVDHIIPLRGKFISGLHIAENLQWLPKSANVRKNNCIDLDELNKE
jgi:hypothetical protein